MSIKVLCSNAKCGHNLNVPDSASGKRVRCPACGEVTQAPAMPPKAAANVPEPRADHVKVQCSNPQCLKKYLAPASMAGKSIRCKACGTMVAVPAAAQAPPPPDGDGDGESGGETFGLASFLLEGLGNGQAAEPQLATATMSRPAGQPVILSMAAPARSLPGQPPSLPYAPSQQMRTPDGQVPFGAFIGESFKSIGYALLHFAKVM